MRVAGTAQAPDIDALVGPRFGRATWLVLANPETGEWTTSANADNAAAKGGVGAKVADEGPGEGAEAIITVHIGPAAQEAFEDAGVAVYQVDNGITVRDALTRLTAHELEALHGPTVAGHWSTRPSRQREE